MSSWYLSAESFPAELLPSRFCFLDRDCRPCKEELPHFAGARRRFGVEDEAFWPAAAEVLSAAVTERPKSTAKSGSLMAFHGSLMAKSMTEEDAATLMAILEKYLEHVEAPENSGGQGTLLPRFLGAFVHLQDWLLPGVAPQRTCFLVAADVFAEVPRELLAGMEKFDLKGSADDRAQRRPGGEFMDWDLLRRDQKWVPEDALAGAALLQQLERDTAFLLAQHAPTGPLGLVDYDSLPESYRGAPGLMDYSLLVGVLPRGTPGGCVRLDVSEQRNELESYVVMEGNEAPEENWQVFGEERTLLLGIIDILQFWTPKKRLARRFKKLLHLERDDDNRYNGAMLDTVKPPYYKPRFDSFMREAFSAGSWTKSLPRLSKGKSNTEGLNQRFVSQLPEAQRRSLDGPPLTPEGGSLLLLQDGDGDPRAVQWRD